MLGARVEVLDGEQPAGVEVELVDRGLALRLRILREQDVARAVVHERAVMDLPGMRRVRLAAGDEQRAGLGEAPEIDEGGRREGALAPCRRFRQVTDVAGGASPGSPARPTRRSRTSK